MNQNQVQLDFRICMEVVHVLGTPNRKCKTHKQRNIVRLVYNFGFFSSDFFLGHLCGTMANVDRETF